MKPTVISINKVDDLSRDPLNIYNDTFLLGYRGSLAHNMYVPGTDPNSIDDALPPEPDRAKAESWLIESIPSYFSRVGLLKTT